MIWGLIQGSSISTQPSVIGGQLEAEHVSCPPKRISAYTLSSRRPCSKSPSKERIIGKEFLINIHFIRERKLDTRSHYNSFHQACLTFSFKEMNVFELLSEDPSLPTAVLSCPSFLSFIMWAREMRQRCFQGRIFLWQLHNHFLLFFRSSCRVKIWFLIQNSSLPLD